MERSNRQALRAAKYDKKASTLEKRALSKDDGLRKATLERSAQKLKYKATTARLKSNQISKTKGYGVKAMKYSVKSDEAARKAAKARMKIANNERYIETMKRKVSSLSADEIQNGYSFVNRLKEIE